MPLTHVPISPLPIDRYRPLMDEAAWADIDAARVRSRDWLTGRAVWNVNSTATGGGVAEMLRPLLAYARGAGVDARWSVVNGNPAFFTLTKRLHNRLHGAPGDGGPLGEAEHELYVETLEDAADELHRLTRPGDVVILHDPQTAGLITHLVDGVHIVWRSHIGRDAPNAYSEEGWRFLERYMSGADAWIFSRREYAPPGIDPARTVIVPPSIDVFSPKNQELHPETVAAVMCTAGLRPNGHEHIAPVFVRYDGSPGRVDRRAELDGPPPPLGAPLVTQVSRWDRLKDPLGVLSAFAEHVPADDEPHLVLAGPDVTAVSDDPEGAEVLRETTAAWRALPAETRRRAHLALLPMDDADENAVIVNALQRRADVVVQKSLAEGFGLTVSEAMWKGRPVVASNVGGIRDQIEDGTTGCLVDPLDLAGFGRRIAALLDDPHGAERMGEAAQARVREHYLGPRHLGQYVDLLERLLTGPPEPAARPAG
jgi:trehalose synthase